jgi:hypothetical protein
LDDGVCDTKVSVDRGQRPPTHRLLTVDHLPARLATLRDAADGSVFAQCGRTVGKASEMNSMIRHTCDHSVLENIQSLVNEEQRLYRRPELSDQDRLRLAPIQIKLDQCWEWLRRRRTAREFGIDA